MLIRIIIKTDVICDVIFNSSLWLYFKSDKPNQRIIYKTEKTYLQICVDTNKKYNFQVITVNELSKDYFVNHQK